MWEWQGLMDSDHRWQSQSLLPYHLAQPLSKKALHWSAVHDVSEAQKGSIEWQELMESNHRLQIWSLLFSH